MISVVCEVDCGEKEERSCGRRRRERAHYIPFLNAADAASVRRSIAVDDIVDVRDIPV